VIDIDFLPKSYHEERARRARMYRRWVMILVVAVTLIGWGIDRHRESAELAWRADALETQARSARQKQSEMTKLREERRSLIYQLKIQRQLDQPVTVTQAVSVLGQLLPDSSGLTRVRVRTHRPSPIPLPDPAEKKSRRKPKRKADPDPLLARDYLQIDIYGIAPDDVAVADLVNTMSDHPLFEKVSMNFSRTDERGEMIIRRFHIGAEVPLDRRYLSPTQTAEVPYED
jgi:Tfp pilus assembly protein PilN